MAGLEWNLDKFIEPSITLVPQETLIYKDLKGHTSLRFTDCIPQNSRKSIDEIEYDLDNNLMEIELVKEDKILYPKELEIILDKKKLLELEVTHFRNKTIKEDEYLYYDNEKNIIGLIDYDNEEPIEKEDIHSKIGIEINTELIEKEIEHLTNKLRIIKKSYLPRQENLIELGETSSKISDMSYQKKLMETRK